MAWKIKIEDKEMSVGELSIDTLQAIADKEGRTWIDIMEGHPASSIGRFRAVIDACAAQLGVASPTGKIVSGADLLAAGFGDEAIIIEMPDIADEPMVDGFPPMPNAPESSSSSGALGDSDGLPTSSDDNDQTTS